MKNSVLLRRIILLLLSAVMLSGMLSAGIYIFVTQRMYVQMRADELLPIARTIAEVLADAESAFDPGMWRLLDRNNKEFLGALLHVYDAEGNSSLNPPHDDGKKPAPADDGIAADRLGAVLAGGELSDVGKSGDGQSYLVVGVPIRKDGRVIGAVLFTKPVGELNDAMRGMNVTLIVSTLISFFVMLIPGFFLARWLAHPIRRMESVALAMSRGDFSVRADETQRGEIGALARAMNQFAEQSSHLEQMRRDYVANVSHELRTPISAIRAMGETLRDGLAKSEEKQTLFYNNIVRESLRLSRLVEDLLELSRLQSSATPLKKTRFDLREVIQNVADIYSHVAAEAGVQFAFYLDMERAVPVCSNADRVEQVLVILLDNAVKHTPTDGVITLSVREEAALVEVAVSDTGDGIPLEDLPRVFERFYTVDQSHSGGGTGLGLSIAHEIVKGLGEEIKAKSTPTGATFTITLHRD